GTVGRQEENPCSLCPDCRLGGRAFVGCEVVEDDNVALCQRRGELCLDIGFEDAPVHGGIDDEGCGEPMTAQPSDESLRLPMPERRSRAQPPTLSTTPAQRVIFVVVPVSSMNTSLCGSSRIRGWRLACHSRRALLTSG